MKRVVVEHTFVRVSSHPPEGQGSPAAGWALTCEDGGRWRAVAVGMARALAYMSGLSPIRFHYLAKAIAVVA